MDTEKIKEIRYMPISKSNELIQTAAFGLSSFDYDLLNYIIMKIKPEDTELKPQIITVKEFCQAFGISERNNYAFIKMALKRLADKSIWATYIDEDGNRKHKLVRWIENPEINEARGGEITLKLDDFWIEHLVALQNRFTILTLEELLPMSSVYGKRIYELCKSILMNHSKAEREIKIEDLKLLLLGKEDYKKKYKDISNFKKRILNPAMQDLKKYGDLDVSYSFVRDSYSYSSIIFKIKRKGYKARKDSMDASKNYFTEKIKALQNEQVG